MEETPSEKPAKLDVKCRFSLKQDRIFFFFSKICLLTNPTPPQRGDVGDESP